MSEIRGKLTIYRKNGKSQTIHDLPIETYMEVDAKFWWDEPIEFTYIRPDGNPHYIYTDQVSALGWEPN